VCGDGTVKELIKSLCEKTKDTLIVNEYTRLTDLKYLDKSLDSFANLTKGDCIVCFNKSDIYELARRLKELGNEVAMIYGSMPPGVKTEQARRFNDPNDPCKILVCTDAIGMGLNFNIKRIIFYSLIKPTQTKENTLLEMDYISVSQALQISGRAGRFNSPYKDGQVTTFKKEDLVKLHEIIKTPLEQIKQAGLHPTSEQIEMFSYHLPNYSLPRLLDIFISLSKLDDSKYFMCMFNDIKYFAQLINHIDNIPIRVRYQFVCAPINRKNTLLTSIFVKLVRLYSLNEPITAQVLSGLIGWPPQKMATSLSDLTHFESIFDILDLYLWLSIRFTDIFVDFEAVRQMRIELDHFLAKSLNNMFSLSSASRKKLNVSNFFRGTKIVRPQIGSKFNKVFQKHTQITDLQEIK
jgi:ATP-dependent RNA helicase SUPV3L1/SUV3